MPKIVVLDSGSLMHIAIFSYGSMLRLKSAGKPIAFLPPPDYTYFMMIISNLKKIGINSDDLIIMAQDGRDSWRKSYDANYKANRKGLRESHEEINWEWCYNKINEINKQLNESSNIHFIQIPHIEADDIQAYIAKNYQDKEVILVTGDRDLEQLAIFPNVKIYSLNLKMNGSKGSYKFIDNPYAIIEDKVRKGDVSDNILVDKENDTEHDIKLRRFIIDLTNLPSFVSEVITPCVDKIMNQGEKRIDFENLPYQNSLAKKYAAIINMPGTLTYEECVEKLEKKKNLTKKKAKIKREEAKKKKENIEKITEFTLT